MPEKLRESQKDAATPAGSKVESYLLELIRGMQPGDKFYSVRELSKLLGVNRGSVQYVLRAMKENGILDSSPHRGYFVKESSLVNEPRMPYCDSAASFFFSEPAAAPIVHFEPGYERFINLGCSCPQPGDSNTDMYLSVYYTAQVIFKNAVRGLKKNFSATVYRMLVRRGMNVPVRNFCVIRENALLLVAARIIRPGDRVALANWGDTEAEIAFLSAGARIAYTGSDLDGMLVEKIREMNGDGRLRVVFIRPLTEMPRCNRLSDERLNSLLLCAEEMNFVVITAEPGQDLHPNRILPPLLMRGHFNHLITITSLCSILPQYYRADIVIAPSDFIRALRHSHQVQQAALEPSRALALTLLEKNGTLPKEIPRLQGYYKTCFNSIRDFYKCHLQSEAALICQPGSLHMYLRFRKPVDLSPLEDWMKNQGLYNALCNNHLEGNFTVDAVRLNYGSPRIAVFKELFIKLSELIRL